MGNGYSELNDPIDQEQRFEDQQKLRESGDEEAQMHDYDFVRALEYGMPPVTGFGVSERSLLFLGQQVRSRNRTVSSVKTVRNDANPTSGNTTPWKTMSKMTIAKALFGGWGYHEIFGHKMDGDPEVWEILGIIHDSDWEETKDAIEKHTVLTLQRVDDERFVHALKSHNTRHTHLAELEGPMEWALECCG